MGRFGRLLIGAASLSLLAVACTRSPGPPAGSGEIDGGTYIAVLEPFLPPPSPPTAEHRAVVFIVPLDGETLPLEVQIEVVDALADPYDVRFVDDARAAIDERSANGKPQDDGLLIGIGPVTAEAPHTTRVEVYRDRNRVEGHLVTLDVTDGRWRLTSDEPVDPEVLSGRD